MLQSNIAVYTHTKQHVHCLVGTQRCMHASDLLACGGGWGGGSHSVLHACTVSFYTPNSLYTAPEGQACGWLPFPVCTLNELDQ
jgi:hypothetical protein